MMEKKSSIKLCDEIGAEHDKKLVNAGFATKCLHCGQDPDLLFGAVNVPIYLSSTFEQDKPGEPLNKYFYSRMNNPTRTRLERAICGVENGKYALIYSSGMAAISGIINFLKNGEEIVCSDDIYGGTQTYFRDIVENGHGIKCNFVDMDNLELFQKTLNSNVKIVYLETPSNPLLKTTDIAEVIKISREYNPEILIVCDNTFMSPYNLKPLDFGVDIVMESATKFICGHSDVVMGIICTNREALYKRLHTIQIATGGVATPFDCFLALRGLKTLSLRMERHNSNGLEVARFLEKHKNVAKVLYPGLESSPYHEIAKKQQHGYGSVVSFIIKGGLEESKKFLESLEIFTFAVSLGSVESLAEHPALMTHAGVPADVLQSLGIDAGLIRLSIGIENLEDLIQDLDNALNTF